MTDLNPLLDWEDFPDFRAIEPGHVLPAVRRAIALSQAEQARLETLAPRTWPALLVPLERLMDRVARLWSLITHLHNVRNSPALRQAYAEAQPLVVDFLNLVGQSRPIYSALLALRDGPEFSDFSHALQRTITLLIRDAELGGVALPPEKRERFSAISRELAALSTEFANNVLDATQSYALTLVHPNDAAGLPEASRQLAAAMSRARGREATAEDGPWTITLDMPSFLSFMQHSSRRDLREAVYRAYITRASSGDRDNLPLIRRILSLRVEMAVLLGFADFADMSLARKMAPSVASVEKLLHTLKDAATDAALGDLIDLGDLAAANGQAEEIMLWDVMYWAERLKEQRFGLHDDMLRPYFPLPSVLEGMFGLARELFGIHITPADRPVWNEDVTYYAVSDDKGEEIAGFYLDPYARSEEKRGGAWMGELYGRSAACAAPGRMWRKPVAWLNCNQRPGLEQTPSLMSFQEVTTLFHEFGHVLQYMLTTIVYGFVSGILRVEWDAVELPSQFMENWCSHRPVLVRLARHYRTGEPLAEEIVDRLLAARTFRAGSNTLRQVVFALTDLALHTSGPQGLHPLETAARIAQEILPLPPLPEDASLCAFSHIFAGGYAAGYYSYKWAEVLSADAFAAFTEAGGIDSALGRRFRDTILALGGSRHPLEVFRLFRGRDPDPTALLVQEGLLPAERA